MDKKYYKDSGSLNASKSKKSQNSPDYWGEICIDIKDMTNVTKTPDGHYIFAISGWKKMSKAGNTYLSIAIKRKSQNDVKQASPKDDMNDDIPF